MSRSFLQFQQVTFTYPAMAFPLLECLDIAFPAGWTGIVGANGSGKSTLLALAAGLIEPTRGVVRAPGHVTLCAQRTDEPPEDLPRFLASAGGPAAEARGRLAIDPDWADRWATLSHGERKRAQIAVALWREPDVLCLDEPTNHVDAEARRLLAAALARHRGIGLLVSHDRELLDTLCGQCLFLDPPRARMRPGSWSAGRAQERLEEQSLRRRSALAREDLRAASRRVTEARTEARAAKRRLSKRFVDRRDRDERTRIDRARITGKDTVGGRLVRRLEANLERAEELSAILASPRSRELALWFASEPARRDSLLECPAGSLPLGLDGALAYPELSLRPCDRVALVGPNGCGKSTLIAHLLARFRLEGERLLYLPQEVDRGEGSAVLDRLRAMGDRELGRALTVVDLLGTEPERLLSTDEPSPGEIRKVLIAMGIARVPHLIVLDEPTNHLDLPSVECLEEALAECRCALLLASHDERFLGRLTDMRWEIVRGRGTGSRRECRLATRYVTR